MSGKIHPAVASAQPFQLPTRDPQAPVFETEAGKKRVEMVLSRYPDKRAGTLPLLAYVQEIRGWVSPEAMVEVAEQLDLTPAYVRSVATFYTMYNKHPVGKYLIQVCTNISCHLNRGEEVLQRFLDETGTLEGETTDDGRYTVIEAECLGACGFATVVQIDNEYYENVSPETVPEILEGLE